MGQHDYMRHTLDCLEEAKAALHLAQRKGQLDAQHEEKLARRLGTLTQQISRIQEAH